MDPAVAAASRAPSAPSLVLENYLGKGRAATDSQLVEVAIGRECRDAESIQGPDGSQCGGERGSEAGESAVPPGQSTTLSDDATSLSGPHTPEGRPAQVKPSLASSPDLAPSSSSVVDDGGAAGVASSHERSLSIPTPPESPSWRREHVEFSLGRKLNVLRSLPAVVVLAEDPESPALSDSEQGPSGGSGVVIQRKLSQVVAGHHVNFTKIRQQMGNINSEWEGCIGGGSVSLCPCLTPLSHTCRKTNTCPAHRAWCRPSG